MLVERGHPRTKWATSMNVDMLNQQSLLVSKGRR